MSLLLVLQMMCQIWGSSFILSNSYLRTYSFSIYLSLITLLMLSSLDFLLISTNKFLARRNQFIYKFYIFYQGNSFKQNYQSQFISLLQFTQMPCSHQIILFSHSQYYRFVDYSSFSCYHMRFTIQSFIFIRWLSFTRNS